NAGGKYKGELIGGQSTPFQSEEGGETIVDAVSRSYTVVGICERPSYEPYTAPGYTALTLDNEAESDSYDLMMTFEEPEKAAEIMERLANSCSEDGIVFSTHASLLRFMGRSTNSSYNRVLYSMGAILMLVILFGSISLIYNAFSISVSERTKQFGLLKSIGATKKQMRQSVLFEACALSVAGIPLGILAGLGGMGITFHFVADMINRLWGTAAEKGVFLTLVVTWQSIVFAAVIAFATIIISALIPAKRAVKLSPMQAIRQSDDVRIRPEKVRTSGLTYRLFGFEGMLASKNFKRSRKKYRATVFSLFISIVLFVAATSFSDYLTGAAESTDNYSEYEVSFYLTEDNK
ncbi:MAG TPA: ABC transporter permease, partial [Lachnospiraceae bacterium]|nr:ABC transporter permease [Lachnospiraceae bacterium]